MGQEEGEIEIDPSGNVTVRTKGIKGEACLDSVDPFVEWLGREESRELTHEHREEASAAPRASCDKLLLLPLPKSGYHPSTLRNMEVPSWLRKICPPTRCRSST